MRILTFSLFFVIASVANAAAPNNPTVADQFVNAQVGELRFVLRKLGSKPFRVWRQTPAEISVLNAKGILLQKLPIKVEIASPTFTFIDLNDDGYIDVLLYDACAGLQLCNGPTRSADVFLFTPKLGRFVKSKTLSNRGDISKSKATGCVAVNYENFASEFVDEEWCFDAGTGGWKITSSSGGETKN